MGKMLLTIIYLLFDKNVNYKTLIFPFTVDIAAIKDQTGYDMFFDPETSCTIVKRNSH